MRAVVQRVSDCSVSIAGSKVADIGNGMLVLLGIIDDDTFEDIKWLVNKIINLRIFPDENSVMNRSLLDVGGDVVVVSQFTLHASTKKGNRPSYIKAAKPDVAIPIYEEFKSYLEAVLRRPIQSGEFGADMKVNLVNDGPVTIIIDTKNKE
ncbi:MAG: D-tyrosyl-tRNA(Tyr) deacylase [Flavobacteriaceae bacterium]|nr:D-tyrosyl-tRNA(Tyr) deacylase [Bacteroidia bacterium]MBT8288514.1 D-tyrosyl-tRNA(Tyr) deacylase [Bacteroidia bacterium]NNF75655.1 D-tyrosyl-tRNA(Tyr) deacylase [Flavobacteriaceae bacterium]NNK71643.1 D-tyrosyl-tRNA(Tyr) deacylase [Flavobacteriaceae bacterium]